MTRNYQPTGSSDENLAQAQALQELANDLAKAAPSWGATSRIGHAHTIAAAALYGLVQAIRGVRGSLVASGRYARSSGVENALLENLTTLVQERGLEDAAQLAYALADGLTTGQVTHLTGAYLYIEKAGRSFQVKLLDRTGKVELLASCEARDKAGAVARSLAADASGVRLRLYGGHMP